MITKIVFEQILGGRAPGTPPSKSALGVYRTDPVCDHLAFVTTLIGGHEPLARFLKLRVAHAPGMPGTFSPPPRVSDPDMHDARAVMHAGIAN